VDNLRKTVLKRCRKKSFIKKEIERSLPLFSLLTDGNIPLTSRNKISEIKTGVAPKVIEIKNQ